MDPFAVPDTVTNTNTSNKRPFDALGTAFWGMPPSLDIEEWNSYLGSQGMYRPATSGSQRTGDMQQHQKEPVPSMNQHQAGNSIYGQMTGSPEHIPDQSHQQSISQPPKSSQSLPNPNTNGLFYW
jgi:hypothetical protein